MFGKQARQTAQMRLDAARIEQNNLNERYRAQLRAHRETLDICNQRRLTRWVQENQPVEFTVMLRSGEVVKRTALQAEAGSLSVVWTLKTLPVALNIDRDGEWHGEPIAQTPVFWVHAEDVLWIRKGDVVVAGVDDAAGADAAVDGGA